MSGKKDNNQVYGQDVQTEGSVKTIELAQSSLMHDDRVTLEKRLAHIVLLLRFSIQFPSKK